MILSTLTIISLLLAVYGAVAIIRDIVVGITNAIKRHKAVKQIEKSKAMINDVFSPIIKDLERYLEESRTVSDMPTPFSAIRFAESMDKTDNCDTRVGVFGTDIVKKSSVNTSNAPATKRKYNKSGKYKKASKKSK